MKRRALLLAAAAAPLAQAGPGEAEPEVHDPCRFDGADGRWLFATGPGLARWHSSDGQHWQRRAPVFDAGTRPAWWAQQVPAHQGLDLWAPKLFAHAGRVWLMYSVSTFGSPRSAIGLASAARAGDAHWRDEGVVLASREGDGFNAIDPDVLRDDDGRLWLAWGSWWRGLQVAALDAATLRPAGEPRFVARRPGGIEAPTLLRRGAWVYLFVSTGHCCRGVDSSYEIRVGRAPSPLGPFTDREGRALLEGGGSLLATGGSRWKGPGHQDVLGDEIVFHAYDAEAAGRPRLRRATLAWSEDAWPRLS